METADQARRVLDFQAHREGYFLIANLPKNSTSLAVRAEEAGADAIMVNIEGEESSHPGHLGTYELHDVYIKDLMSTIAIPCGIFVGGANPLTPEYWETIVSAGFSFVDMYAHHMPLFVSNDGRVRKVLAISTGHILEQVRILSEMEGTDAIEVAIVPQQARGNPFTTLDYATLTLICRLSSKPIFLRAQKQLLRSEIPAVMSLGVRGLVIDPSILSGAEEAYRDEIAGFSPRREISE
jgi:hypothetical protein